MVFNLGDKKYDILLEFIKKWITDITEKASHNDNVSHVKLQRLCT